MGIHEARAGFRRNCRLNGPLYEKDRDAYQD